MQFILMTDLHLRDPGGSAEAAAHAVHVDTCIDHAAEACPNSEFCVITGDLAEAGESGAYRWLRDKLSALPFPAIPMLGNHDDRDAFRSVFGDWDESGGFIQSVRRFGDTWLVFLDTHNPGSDAGLLCANRLGWLNRQLRQAGSDGVYVFMHHPPCNIGDPVLDPIKLSNADEFAAVLQRHGNVQKIFFGHVHRTMFLVWNGIPCASLDRLVASPLAASQHRNPVFGLLAHNGADMALTLKTLIL